MLALHAAAPATPAWPAALPPTVLAALARAQVPPEALAVVVADAAGGEPRLAWQAARPVNPASVMKLVTTYAGLDLLGPAYRWTTPVYLQGALDAGGTLRGNLVLRGQGDPALVTERLWLLLGHVRALGVRHVAGDIVLDRSAFVLAPHDPGAFDGEPWRAYNAAPDALLVNYRAATLRFVPDPALGAARVTLEPPLAGVAVPASVPLAPPAAPCGDWRAGLQATLDDPAGYAFAGRFAPDCGEREWTLAPADAAGHAARAIAGQWAALGGTLAGTVRDGPAPASLAPAFAAESPPLAAVVRDINKFSNNVMAQQLFLTLSLQARGVGTFEASRALVRAWWRERLGLPEPAPVLDNGSGLSREARITAAGLARLLQAAWRSPHMPELLASLPIAGVDGTLSRSRARPGAARLKTGSLRDVAALAGYVDAPDGRRMVLAAVVNHPNAAAARDALDALVEWAAGAR